MCVHEHVRVYTTSSSIVKRRVVQHVCAARAYSGFQTAQAAPGYDMRVLKRTSRTAPSFFVDWRGAFEKQ